MLEFCKNDAAGKLVLRLAVGVLLSSGRRYSIVPAGQSATLKDHFDWLVYCHSPLCIVNS